MAFAKSLKTRSPARQWILTCPQCESVVRRYCPGSTPLAALPLRLNRRRPDGSAAPLIGRNRALSMTWRTKIPFGVP